MAARNKSITLLRLLLIFLVLIVVLTIGTFFWIRDTEEEKIAGALNFLRFKDRNLEMMEKSFQKLYEADNDFWLYTLTYDKVYSTKYSEDINALLATLDTLRLRLEAYPAETIFVEEASESILRKEELSESFIRMKRLADSLLYGVVKMGSIQRRIQPQRSNNIQRYYPDLQAMGIDTLALTTNSEREKKELFKKVREFLEGNAADSELTIDEVSQVIAGQTNLYYQNQLQLQNSFRKRMETQEMKLILTNKRLMEELNEILYLLDGHVEKRNTEIHGSALATINRSARIINLTSMVSLGIVLILLVLIIVTIGRIIRYQKQLQAARRKAENDAAEKSRFLAYMSHELRTPLTSVVGFTEQLKHTPLNQTQEKYLSSLHTSSEMLLTTVNDILDLSKLDSGKMKFLSNPFIPSLVVEEIVNSLRPAATKKGLNVAFTNLVGEKTVLSGDEMRLKQVLVNLLNNAVKYTEQGEIVVTISLKPRISKQYLKVQIADTGIGISKEHLGEVFSEFSQVHEQSGKKWIIGTGLGLPICKKIVEQQGGKIWAESQPGKGSVFSFIIPYNISKRQREEVAPPEKGIDTSIFTGKRILIVDDTDINLKLLEAIFDNWGVKVDIAKNGKEALELIKTHPFNLILSDVNMPEMDGIEMTRQIRHDPSPELSKIPVIILTANIVQDEIGKFQQAGVTDFIMKPFLMPDLYRVIRKHLK
ncbi:MAG: ATP-binding protein [Bacteroidota bacterium]